MADGLLDFIAGKTVRQVEKTAGGGADVPVGFRSTGRRIGGRIGRVNLRTLIRTYRSTAFACIQKRGQSLASLDYGYQRRLSPQKVVDLPMNHWLPKLWQNPTIFRHITPATIWKWSEIWHCLIGEYYIITPLDRDPVTGYDVPIGLYPVPTSMVTVNYDRNGRIADYDVRSGDGEPETYDPREVCYFMNPAPAVDTLTMYTRGMGLVEAAIDDIQADETLKAYVRNALVNPMPPWFVKAPNSTRQQRDGFREQLKERNEEGNQLPVGFLEPTWEVEVVDSMRPARDSRLLSLPYKKSICEALDTPLGFFDTEILNGRNTVETLLYMFGVFTIEPRGTENLLILNRHFQQFEEGVEMTFTRIDRRDSEAERAEDEFLLKHNLATPNMIAQRRALTSVPPEQGGDTYFTQGVWIPGTIAMQGGQAALRAAAAAGEDVPAVTDDPENVDDTEADGGSSSSSDASKARAAHRSIDADERLERVAYFKKYADPAESFESRIAEKISNVFKDLEREVLANAGNQKAWRERDAEFDLFDEEKLRRALEAATSPEIRRYILDTLERAATELGYSWDAVESQFSASVREMLKASTSRITESIPTIKADLEKLLSDNHDKRESDLREAIREKFPQYTEGKANTIARTTRTYATGASQRTVADELEVELEWLDQQNAGANHRHIHMRGQRPAGDGNFTNTVTGNRGPHPGALGSADDDVNCMCILRFRPKKK